MVKVKGRRRGIETTQWLHSWYFREVTARDTHPRPAYRRTPKVYLHRRLSHTRENYRHKRHEINKIDCEALHAYLSHLCLSLDKVHPYAPGAAIRTQYHLNRPSTESGFLVLFYDGLRTHSGRSPSAGLWSSTCGMNFPLFALRVGTFSSALATIGALFSVFLLLFSNNSIAPRTTAMTTKPPTTPPAIAPILVLEAGC
jgi:hypothetical protein